ncbi:MAG: hypothetical protein LDL44_02025 [Caenispirillum sp.]|nr:hypothetical protein [Caenispirillum sp.]
MVAYNFQARFAAAVEPGEKAITIRTIGRRRHARIGERLQLCTGQRTRAWRKLVDPDPVVTSVQPITFHADGRVWIEGHDWLTDLEIEILARLDRFSSAADFLAFLEPPEGIRQAVSIEWRGHLARTTPWQPPWTGGRPISRCLSISAIPAACGLTQAQFSSASSSTCAPCGTGKR